MTEQTVEQESILIKQYRRRGEALGRLLAIFDDGYLGSDLGEHLTCAEADAFVAFFKAFSLPDVAKSLLESHALADDDGDDSDHVELKHRLEAEESQAAADRAREGER